MKTIFFRPVIYLPFILIATFAFANQSPQQTAWLVKYPTKDSNEYHNQIETAAVTNEIPQDTPYQLEFWIGDVVPSRQWGHVSLRVLGPDSDWMLDFGRYGEMWEKQAAGDPILRIWKSKIHNYIKYHANDGGVTTRIVFASTAERNKALISYINKLLSEGEIFKGKGRNSQIPYATNYLLKSLGEFHASRMNCTVFAIDSFIAGFPEYKLHEMAVEHEYLTARQFDSVIRNAWVANSWIKSWLAARADGKHILWPLDLQALLIEKISFFPEIIRIDTYKRSIKRANESPPPAKLMN